MTACKRRMGSVESSAPAGCRDRSLTLYFCLISFSLARVTLTCILIFEISGDFDNRLLKSVCEAVGLKFVRQTLGRICAGISLVQNVLGNK